MLTIPNPESYLIILIQRLEVTHMTQSLNLLVVKTNAVVEVTKPDHCIVVLNRSVTLELQAVTNRFVVTIAFFVVGKAGCKMGCDEADRRVAVFHANSDGAFVTSHARHASLSSVSYARNLVISIPLPFSNYPLRF
jgi:hypothetical protein